MPPPREIDVVRRYIWAFDNDSETFRDTIHPEIEWFPFEQGHTPAYGVEDAMRVRNRWLECWEEHRIDVEEVIEEDDGVVAAVELTARGKASGIEVSVCLHLHYKLRDEKVVYLFEHEDRATALEAACRSG
jgi:ketosteroid isomerase-like protein